MNLLEICKEQFAIPVLRETRAEHLEGLTRAIAKGGLNIVEITLMSDIAYDVIKKLSGEKEIIIGAGTVTSLDEAKKAIDSGAKFLVSPGTPVKAIEYSHSQKIPFYPGVLTPTEIITARDLGCEMLKVFPISSVGGASYIKSLQGPFPKLKWMATGGISLENIRSFTHSGVNCVGVGNQLTPTELVNAKDWDRITALAESYVDLLNEMRKA